MFSLETMAAKVAAALIAAAVVFAAGMTVGFTVQGWRKDAKISDLKAEHANQQAVAASAVVADMERTASAVHSAALRYSATESRLANRLDLVHQELKNAKPLPVDCKPDAFRVRQLRAAVDAANEAAAVGHKAGATVP